MCCPSSPPVFRVPQCGTPGLHREAGADALDLALVVVIASGPRLDASCLWTPTVDFVPPEVLDTSIGAVVVGRWVWLPLKSTPNRVPSKEIFRGMDKSPLRAATRANCGQNRSGSSWDEIQNQGSSPGISHRPSGGFGQMLSYMFPSFSVEGALRAHSCEFLLTANTSAGPWAFRCCRPLLLSSENVIILPSSGKRWTLMTRQMPAQGRCRHKVQAGKSKFCHK